ncbi:hypothetical protein SLH46_11165 [Draconibacterium sp. IB214405]|uniref:hypothetical protein n=1 Tax=Draconibacterium sp. IB214405 TaxID=3097352 RepID=UPI002A0FE11D|nr:hypothetical protein [Draconibacterium sp. IB214405]MDX8339746.1 hypothetical protein [Draconibacterium sp. IB214405]
MKKSIKKISFLICSVTFLTVTINLMSITSVQADPSDSEEIEPRGFEPHYYIGTQSWCCFDGSTGCIPLNC